MDGAAVSPTYIGCANLLKSDGDVFIREAASKARTIKSFGQPKFEADYPPAFADPTAAYESVYLKHMRLLQITGLRTNEFFRLKLSE